MSHNIRQAVWYLLPSSLIFLIFYYWPLLQNIYLSFFSWNMVSPTMKYVGVENYWKILNSAELGKIILNTVLFVVILLWIYNPLAGPLSIILGWFGVASPRWFKEDYLVIFAICTIIGWKVFGYNLIVMLAAMVSVPREMLEAARLENASNWAIFKKIILPMTSSTALYVFTITVVFGLQYVLVPVNMLTQGGPDQGSSNLVYIIYQYAFTFFQTGSSAAYAVVTLLLYFVFLFVKYKYLDRKVYYEN